MLNICLNHWTMKVKVIKLCDAAAAITYMQYVPSVMIVAAIVCETQTKLQVKRNC